MKFVQVLSAFAIGCGGQSAAPPASAESTPTNTAEPSRGESTDAQTLEATGSCNGQVTQELAVEMRRRGVESRHCYERALRDDKSLMGRMMVEATYEADGTQRDVKLASDAVGNAAMAACVVDLFDAPVRSAPTGGCVVIHIPLNFQSESTATEAPEP